MHESLPGTKPPTSTLQHFRLLLVFGDALCSFNPIYGQGMTAAALEAVALADCLTQGTRTLAPRFFAKASEIIDTPWQIAAGNDLRHPRLSHQQSAIGRFMNWYIGKVHHAGAIDPAVACAFLRVANLMEPPTRLFAGGTLLKVMRGNLHSVPEDAPPAPRRAPARISETVD